MKQNATLWVCAGAILVMFLLGAALVVPLKLRFEVLCTAPRMGSIDST